MASKKENLKALFTNTRSRVIIFFTAGLLILAVLIGGIKLVRSQMDLDKSTADISSAPTDIQSIPGAINPTEEYASLQQTQNVQQAAKALKTSGSAIPTIIRTQEFGNGIQSVGPQQGEGGVGFSTLALTDSAGDQKNFWLRTLKDSNCSQDALKQVMAEGATLKDIKAACSCVQLKDNKYRLADLQSVCSCKELKAAGFNARQLKDAGFTAGQLRTCGFDACELRNAGFTAQEMKDGGFSDGELKGAGYTDAEIKGATPAVNLVAAALPAGISADDVRKAGCDVEQLRKLRLAGVKASSIRQISGCSAQQLKAAGYSAKDLKDAGFSAAELRKAGFSPKELRDAGYSARDLLNAGYTPEELASAGYSPDEIKAGQAVLPPGVSAKDVKAAGCDVETLKRERLAGISAQAIRQYAGCSAQALKAAGFSDAELANAGFSPEEIKAAETGLPDKATLSDEAIKAAGCEPDKLKELLRQGVTAKKIRELNGCSIDALKAAGYDAKALADAGFTPEQLLAAGFSPEELTAAGLSPTGVIASGRKSDCSVESLKAARALGVTATTIKQTLGCSAAAMKAAGFSASDLKNAGFTAAELKNAGFSAADLKDAGFSVKDLQDAGFSPEELKNAGFIELGTSVAGLPKANLPAQAASSMTAIPSIAKPSSPQSAEQENTKQLQAILKRQQSQLADQRSQQDLQQRISLMQGKANEMLAAWKTVPTQAFVEGSEKEETISKIQSSSMESSTSVKVTQETNINQSSSSGNATIKTGDILFAVLDTSVNSDEPSPILATIVTGKLKGSKLIGSFNLPSNADKMIINFNTLSVPGIDRTISINAYAIDPNTARTAMASSSNHHYLQRYGSLFAATFLEGFGNAFQSANTTITIGGTGGVTNTTVQSGIGRSLMENAVIGLATLGKNWGQVAQQQFNRPTTVQVCSGTGFGVLFTQDVTIN